MAIIDTAQITERLQDILGRTTVDSQEIVNVINEMLPTDQRLGRGVGITMGVYKRFGSFDKIDAKNQRITAGLWSGDASVLNNFYTSSEQSNSSKNYYYNVYAEDDSDVEDVEFAIAYGHRFGSGSQTLVDSATSTLASRAVYSQYTSVLLDDDETQFKFDDTIDAVNNDIFVINVSRDRYREKMDAQNWQITIDGSTYIDDSGKKFDTGDGKLGTVFNVVSGSLNIGTHQPATIEERQSSSGYGFGKFYPQHGIIVLNPLAFDDDHSITPVLDTDTEKQNHKLLLDEIESFEARRVENISTQHFFVRATNREFNFSNNPTFADENGRFRVPGFETDPKTYITSIGLYNDSNELIAVAKSSQPIPKSFDREVLIKVRLDF